MMMHIEYQSLIFDQLHWEFPLSLLIKHSLIVFYLIAMAEQNIWKKQMLANKNKPPESPKPNDTSATTNAPPWAKNNPINTPTLNNWTKNSASTDSATTNQPAWMKSNSGTVNQPPSPRVDAPKTNAVSSNAPPWMKQNQEQPATNAVSNPPWAKQGQEATNSSPLAKTNSNSTPNTNATTGNQPPWMKANNSQQSAPPAPAWANKNNTSSPQPTWANKGAGQTATNPPWMKKEENVAPQSSNLLKAQRMADVERQKKELQEKQRQLEEEEKERKRQQKLKRQKQEQENNIQRELKAMEMQDQLSAKRQKFDKQQLERIEKEKKQRQEREREAERLRIQKEKIQAEQREKQKQRQKQKLEKQQKIKLENQRLELEKLQKSKSKSVKKSRRGLQSSKISHISSIKVGQNLQTSSINAFQNIQIAQTERDPSQPENLFHKYTRLMNEQCCETDYRSKIAIQKSIIQTQLQFKRQCQTEIIELMKKKKITNRKRKIVFSNSMQIRYGLCQGKKGENGLQFLNEEAQKLKNIFLYYEAITKCIVSLLKKKINIHFRVPLLNLAEYKGITFLLQYICQELVEINETDIGLFQEVSNEILILEKELQLCYDSRNDFLKPLTKNQLMVKKVNIYQEDYYILYIKQQSMETKSRKLDTNPIKSSSKIQTPIPNITYLKLIEYITDETVMLPFYNSPLLPTNKNYDFYQKIASPASKNLIKEITLANSINTVYRSCQGEVEQNIFFELILNENKQIWDMIKSTGFAQKEVPSPIALAYLQKISSLKFIFTNNFYTKKQKQLIQSIKPNVYIQKHQFEMLQFIKNLEKYIAQGKQDLIEQSMRMNRELWQEINKSDSDHDSSQQLHLMKIKKEVNYLLSKQKDDEALQLLQNSQKKIATFSIQNIPISLLFIKIFIRTDAEMKLLKKLSQLLQILEFYFKEETIIHSYVYTIVGGYYSKKKSDEQHESKVITFYEHAINIALKLYGEKAQQVAEIYLSRANSMLNLQKRQSFQKDMSLALKIYKMHSKNNSKIAQCNYLLGKVACIEGKREEGIELMQSSSTLFLKMENYVESLNVSFQILHYLEADQLKFESQIEKIVEICFRHKSIWAFQKIITLLLDRQLHCYTSLTIQTISELFSNEQEDRSNEEIIIDLEEQIKGFTCFIEIIRWSLSILAAKVIIRKETTSDYWKALNIMKDVIHFYSKEKKVQTSPIKQAEMI